MPEIDTEIDVDAPPAVVWEVLTDFGSYPEWNPLVTEAVGDVREGAKVRIRLAPDGKPAMDTTVEVTRVDPERRLQWVGTLPIPGLFTGRHTMAIDPRDDGGVRFVHGESFSGLLAWLVVDDDLVESYRAMNRALKQRAERVADRRAVERSGAE
jgi:hypothetical protein